MENPGHFWVEINNGEGKIPHVTIRSCSAMLEIFIRSGTPHAIATTRATPTWQLGLHGMRRRLEAFGGTLNLYNDGEETILEVKLPVQSKGRASSPALS